MFRWSLILGAHSYELGYRPGKKLVHVDALSHLPLATPLSVAPSPWEVMLFVVPDAPLHASRIAALTLKDPVWMGLREVPSRQFGPYWSRQRNFVLRGNQVVVPGLAREVLLSMLNDIHPGIVRMRALAWSYVWWPGIDMEIEAVVCSCQAMLSECRLAGLFKGKAYDIVVNSRWM